MALSIYQVLYTVPAPPAYKGDPYRRTSRREKFICTDSPQSAAAYVKDQLDRDGVAHPDVAASFFRPLPSTQPEGTSQ